MKQIRLASIVFTVLVVTLALAPAAQAQATRTWVSGVGDDANPCSRTAPCKTFAGAISKTAAGGEISALDPGGFGAVTITKAITINGDGTLAGILAALTNGVIVNAGANDKVILRNISINGANNGLNGIRYLAGGQLMVEHVTITGFQSSATSRAIDVSLASSGELLVSDTTITNCENGIRLNTTAGQLLAALDNVRIQNVDVHGFEAAGGSSFATIKHSLISNNNQDGVRASGASAIINVEDSVLTFNNGAAVSAAFSGARIRLNGNTIVNNNVGVGIVGGAFVNSTGDNRIDGNGSTTPPNGAYVEQ